MKRKSTTLREWIADRLDSREPLPAVVIGPDPSADLEHVSMVSAISSEDRWLAVKGQVRKWQGRRLRKSTPR